MGDQSQCTLLSLEKVASKQCRSNKDAFCTGSGWGVLPRKKDFNLAVNAVGYLTVSSDKTAIVSGFVISVLSTTQQSNSDDGKGKSPTPYFSLRPSVFPEVGLRQDASFYQCERKCSRLETDELPSQEVTTFGTYPER